MQACVYQYRTMPIGKLTGVYHMQDLASAVEREAAAALAARLSPTAVLLPCERGQVPRWYGMVCTCTCA